MKALAPLAALPALLAAFAAGPRAAEPAPIRFTERLIQARYQYAFGIAAADLDGDGDVDLVSSDAVGGSLYWFENDGKGRFKRHVIAENEPGWFERNAVADLDGDRRPDVVVVKN